MVSCVHAALRSVAMPEDTGSAPTVRSRLTLLQCILTRNEWIKKALRWRDAGLIPDGLFPKPHPQICCINNHTDQDPPDRAEGTPEGGSAGE